MRTTSFLTAALTLTLFATTVSFAQGENTIIAGQDSSVIIVDDIRFETTQFVIDSATRTATATVSLTSMNERPRELKINIYGTQLVDTKRNSYYFSTIALGRVLMRFEDRQNYLHYLLQPGIPVTLTITATDISSDAAAIHMVKVVFEDSKEEGRFLDAYLTGVAAP